MKLGERIEEFSAERKISFDGECYHLRLPIDIMKTVRKYVENILNVHWSGIWKNDDWLYVVLGFKMKETVKETKSEKITVKQNDDGDYVVLKDSYVNVYERRTR